MAPGEFVAEHSFSFRCEATLRRKVQKLAIGEGRVVVFEWLGIEHEMAAIIDPIFHFFELA